MFDYLLIPQIPRQDKPLPKEGFLMSTVTLIENTQFYPVFGGEILLQERVRTAFLLISPKTLDSPFSKAKTPWRKSR